MEGISQVLSAYLAHVQLFGVKTVRCFIHAIALVWIPVNISAVWISQQSIGNVVVLSQH